jgi:ABC-type Mn2+/Zn2+ transport system ATPase subunit
MALVSGLDNQAACRKALSAVNFAVNSGLTNAIIAANGTVTLLKAAILALTPVAGSAPDALMQCAEGVQIGNTCGAIPSTTGVTTVAGLRALLTDNLPGVAATYTGELCQ